MALEDRRAGLEIEKATVLQTCTELYFEVRSKGMEARSMITDVEFEELRPSNEHDIKKLADIKTGYRQASSNYFDLAEKTNPIRRAAHAKSLEELQGVRIALQTMRGKTFDIDVQQKARAIMHDIIRRRANAAPSSPQQ